MDIKNLSMTDVSNMGRTQTTVGDNIPTMEDVAKMAGVDVATLRIKKEE